MANKFTRTVKTFEAKAYQLEIKEGQPVAVVIASVVYNAASDAESHARKAFKENVSCWRQLQEKPQNQNLPTSVMSSSLRRVATRPFTWTVVKKTMKMISL